MYIRKYEECIIIDNLAMYTFTWLHAYDHRGGHTDVCMFVCTHICIAYLAVYLELHIYYRACINQYLLIKCMVVITVYCIIAHYIGHLTVYICNIATWLSWYTHTYVYIHTYNILSCLITIMFIEFRNQLSCMHTYMDSEWL